MTVDRNINVNVSTNYVTNDLVDVNEHAIVKVNTNSTFYLTENEKYDNDKT